MSQTRKAAQELQRYTDRINELNKSMQKFASYTKEYKDLFKQKTVVEKQAKKALEDLDAAYKKLKPSLKSHTKSIKEAQNAYIGYNKAVLSTKEPTNGFLGRMDKFGRGVNSAIGTLSRFATAGLLVSSVIKGLKFVFVDSVKASIEFEKALANLSAVAGVGGSDLDLLGQSALKAAGQTKFTAIEIVGLQTELSKLGLSAKETAEVTASVAFAAQALDAPLSSTAELVGKLKNQFNLLAEDSDEIADILVTTINNSALSLNTFSTAVQYVGPIARDLGLSLQQTAASMAILADNGFTASRVGTGLRGIFTELGSTSADVEKELKRLADAQISLGEASELVGKRNAAQLITLLANLDVLDESNDRYYQQGRALEAAAVQAESFSGSMEILKSAINEAQISFGDMLMSIVNVENLVGAFSTTAAETLAGFRAIRNESDTFNEALKNVANGASLFDEAVRVAAAEAGKSVEEFKKDYEEKWGEELKEITEDSTSYIGRLWNDLSIRMGSALGYVKEEARTVNGVYAALAEGAGKIKDNLIIDEERKAVDDAYNDTLQRLITSKLEGNNVDKEAIDKADEILKRRIKERKLIEALTSQIETLKNKKGELNAEEQAQVQFLEEQILRGNAADKALEGLQRRFANLQETPKQKDKKEQEDVVRRRARDFKVEIDLLEDRKDAIERNTEVEVKAAEAKGRYFDAIRAEVMGNKDLVEANNDLINMAKNEVSSLEEKIEKEKENVDSKGKLTKQASANISVMEQELKTLRDTILAYDEKNESLQINVKTLEDSEKAFETQLKSIEKQFKDGDITREAMLKEKENLRQGFIGLLDELAEKSPDLKKAIDAIKQNIDTGNDKINWNEILAEGLEEAIDVVSAALDGFNDTAFENTKNRLEAEKEALKSRYETEDYLAKQQFENGLINEAQYRRRQAALRKKQLAEENAIDRKLFEAEQKRDKNTARTDYLEALASIIPTLITKGESADPIELAVKSAITASLATASFGAEMTAINKRKFFPKKFAEGGMVNGPSHADGGVPFTVQGQGGYEMEGGEFIVNKRAASLHRDLLEKINGSVKPNTAPQPMKFAQGGIVNKTTTMIAKDSSESVDYLKAIAEATTQSAINTGKPVKAYVTSKDLRKDENARRIKDNNTTI